MRIKMKMLAVVLMIAICIQMIPTTTVSASGSDPFVGEIVLFAGNFAPKGWAF